MNHIAMRISGLVQRRIAAFEQMGNAVTDVVAQTPTTSISVQKLVSFFERRTVCETNNTVVNDIVLDESLETKHDTDDEKLVAKHEINPVVPYETDSIRENKRKVEDVVKEFVDTGLDEILNDEQVDLNSGVSTKSGSSFETAPSQFTGGSGTSETSEDGSGHTAHQIGHENLATSAKSESDTDLEIEPNLDDDIVWNYPDRNAIILDADISQSAIDDARNNGVDRATSGITNKRRSINENIRRMISKGISIGRKKPGKSKTGRSKVNPETSTTKNRGHVQSNNCVPKMKTEDDGRAENNKKLKKNDAKNRKGGSRGKNVNGKCTRQRQKRKTSFFSKLIPCVPHRRGAQEE